MTITIKNEEDEMGGGYQLNGASTIPTAGLVEWSGGSRMKLRKGEEEGDTLTVQQSPNGPGYNGLDTSIEQVVVAGRTRPQQRLRRYKALEASWAWFPSSGSATSGTDGRSVGRHGQWLAATELWTNGPVGGQGRPPAPVCSVQSTREVSQLSPFDSTAATSISGYTRSGFARPHTYILHYLPPWCSSRPTLPLVGRTPMSVGDVLADDEPAGIHAVRYRGRLLSYQAQQSSNSKDKIS
ncbi:hypothetical protein BO94DRAFT_550137 [Aspergillus sclerotioniger CBS 115572]|uniref:Uncharacterized protein n=1 Tax=Aspergillus sclerotioniger CBS 115572 TaxID=1450535 RepID=A0A317VG73_9EURO|nr:hypothetical protein BO94DRAFT_550137 [Aspergillus sclerotioniger CBS 115572]PWY72127.1 hypothetical protein BO94DRAFT_550137 [Aspergillus sclerotioniger CBS 115572]